MPSVIKLPALEIDSVSKAFGGLTVLDSVCLQVDKGQALLLTGANGAGKTTLFDIVSGFLEPDTGTIRVMGKAISPGKPQSAAKLGLRRTFQEVRVFPTLTVIENVMMGGTGGSETALGAIFRSRAHYSAEKSLQDQAQQWIEFVSLSDFTHEPAGQLSFGQQKLVELARTLTDGAEVLLLDEPIAGVHKDLAQKIVAVLERLHAQGKTMIIIEHERDMMNGLADDVLVLADAGLVATAGRRNACI